MGWGRGRAAPSPPPATPPRVTATRLPRGNGAVGAPHAGTPAVGVGSSPGPLDPLPSPQPQGGVTQLTQPLSKGGAAPPEPPFSLFGARSLAEVAASKVGGERKSCWGSQSRPGCFRRDPGPRLKSHRKQDLTPLVPASRELWFWSRFDFEDCRKITVSPL